MGKIGLERGGLISLTGSSFIITHFERREPGEGHCLLSRCSTFPILGHMGSNFVFRLKPP